MVAQDPAAGKEVAEGGSVAPTVSSGASPSPTPTLAVPKVVGSTQASAVQMLGEAGFVVLVTEEASLTQAGEVISQAPTAGVMATSGSNVTITVPTDPAVQPLAGPSR